MVSEVDLDNIPPYLKAVTVLRPRGDLVAEVLAVVSRVHGQRRRVRVYLALTLFFITVVLGVVLTPWVDEWLGNLLPSQAVHNGAPVKLIGSLTNSGWVLHFDILTDGDDTVREISYKFANEDSFRSTCFTQTRDPRTGLAQPRSYVEVTNLKGTRTLFVKYTDSRGREHGPFTLIFDEREQVVAETNRFWRRRRTPGFHFANFRKERCLYTSLTCCRTRMALKRFNIPWIMTRCLDAFGSHQIGLAQARLE
jgi:hypothetical protein